MIEIIGEEGSSEFDAPLRFRHIFTELLGERISRDEIKIVVYAKMYGERRQDVDLIIIGKLARPFTIQKSSVVTKEAKLLSFFLAVEVKDHSPERIEFRGPKVLVSYQGRFSDASEQSHQQMMSVRSYIERAGLKPPYLLNLLLLNNCPTSLLPIGRNNILGGDFLSSNLLEIIYTAHERNLTAENTLILSFGQQQSATYVQMASLFAKRILPSKLDRKKIELIPKQSFEQKYANALGEQLLIFAGPGGTGKTVKLLQLAHYAYQTLGKRALILTYNLALVSDIRRLFTIMGIVYDIASAQVRISTVHSFMYELLCSTQLFSRGDSGYLGLYESLKDDLLKNIDAIADTDFEHWDFIFVDEGQDWPENERDIIYKLFKPQNVVVAEGKSQLIRSSAYCNWAANWKNQKVTLRKSLRLKHDICKFAESVIDRLEIADWQMEADVSVHGGRVVLVVGDLMSEPERVKMLIAEAIADKNALVDLLFCVPPSMALPSAEDEEQSVVAKKLQRLGYMTWDGVDEHSRHGFPAELNQLRVVQYDSCRGLEGWTVFNLAFEELYDCKKASYKPTPAESSDMFFDHEEFSERSARKWLAIPITRAIDTLVINLKNPEHWLAKEILELSSALSCVEVIRL